MEPVEHELANAFAQSGGADQGVAPEAIGASLAALYAEGQRTWNVAVAPAVFAHHVASVLDDESSLAELHPDLVLAAAALGGDRHAIQQLDGIVRTAAVRATLGGVSADDLAQHVREQLLVPAEGGAAPKLGQYAGRGPLGGWLRVLVTRTALTMQRTENRRTAKHSGEEQLADIAVGDSSPELQMLRSAYAVPFRDAFREALATLPTEERNLLRMHLVDGLSIDRLGALYNIHRATAARRLTRAREAVLAKTRELLETRLRISQSDFSSLVGLMLSRVEVSTSF